MLVTPHPPRDISSTVPCWWTPCAPGRQRLGLQSAEGGLRIPGQGLGRLKGPAHHLEGEPQARCFSPPTLTFQMLRPERLCLQWPRGKDRDSLLPVPAHPLILVPDCPESSCGTFPACEATLALYPDRTAQPRMLGARWGERGPRGTLSGL